MTKITTIDWVVFALQRELEGEIAMAYCHKHGQGQWTGRCVTCDDELISLGIQADKDKIAELEAKIKLLESKVCTCAAKDMPFGRCCKAD